MKRYRTLSLLLLLSVTLLSNPATAQEEADADAELEENDGDAGEESTDEENAAPTDPLESARSKGGDILFMKSGAIMGGVQILKSTPLSYQVELLPGMPPMEIPRRQVESVEYDDIDRAREKRHRESNRSGDEELTADGKELAPEFVAKLNLAIPETPLEFDTADYVQVFTQITQKTGVVITVDSSLLEQLPGTRTWTVTITPEMTLMELLQKKWAVAFPGGRVTYERDMVVLKKRDLDASANPEQTTPDEEMPVVLPEIDLGN